MFHVETGKCVQTFMAPAGVFDVDWNVGPNGGNGDKIAISTAKGSVTIMDVRKMP